ncbi:hypothetical protein [Sphingorhabdus sp.]|uniref:hypothetical protein n=1 Tax=Sphingorhabdus sp. TaxID=1902408 RepID=UPI00333E32C7
MRIDPDVCRDPELLAAEVRRLQAVIAAGEPAITDAEREAVANMIHLIETRHEDYGKEAHYLRNLLERTQ